MIQHRSTINSFARFQEMNDFIYKRKNKGMVGKFSNRKP